MALNRKKIVLGRGAFSQTVFSRESLFVLLLDVLAGALLRGEEISKARRLLSDALLHAEPGQLK